MRQVEGVFRLVIVVDVILPRLSDWVASGGFVCVDPGFLIGLQGWADVHRGSEFQMLEKLASVSEFICRYNKHH